MTSNSSIISKNDSIQISETLGIILTIFVLLTICCCIACKREKVTGSQRLRRQTIDPQHVVIVITPIPQQYLYKIEN